MQTGFLYSELHPDGQPHVTYEHKGFKNKQENY